MYKAIKIELKLTNEQKIQVNKTIGVERFIYNEYIKYNQEQYKLGNKFVSANDFSKSKFSLKYFSFLLSLIS